MAGFASSVTGSQVNIMPHPFGIEVREYQHAIAKSALESNTLVVLPTALGKTIIALLVAVERR